MPAWSLTICRWDESLNEFHVSGQGEDGGVRLRGARIEGAVFLARVRTGRLRSADIGSDRYGSENAVDQRGQTARRAPNRRTCHKPGRSGIGDGLQMRQQ